MWVLANAWLRLKRKLQSYVPETNIYLPWGKHSIRTKQITEVHVSFQPAENNFRTLRY